MRKHAFAGINTQQLQRGLFINKTKHLGGGGEGGSVILGQKANGIEAL